MTTELHKLLTNDAQQLDEAIANLGKPRDQDAMCKAAARMDQMREETFKRVGLLDVAVPFIRELRDR